jgi:hypothetical protein
MAKLTPYAKRIRLAIERAELVLRNRFEIKRVLSLKAGGWNAFMEPVLQKTDPRLRISNFDPFKKHYPRSTKDLDVLSRS